MSELNVYLFLKTGAVCELFFCILYIVENQRRSLIPRVAYGYKISAALLNVSEDICVFIVYKLVVFVFIK